MKKIKTLIITLFLGLVLLSGLNSCGDDVCSPESYEGEFVGKYWLLGLIPLTNNDNVTVTTSGNTISLTSAILQTTFDATYDPATGTATVSHLFFPYFVIGGDTLYSISVENGTVELDASCDDLYLNLSGVTVDSGTVTLPAELGLSYPLTNVSMTTKNGLTRQ